MTVRGITPQALADLFRASVRIAPASVSLVTARGADGGRVPPRSIGGKGQGSVGSAGDSVITNLYRRGGPRSRHLHNFRRANRRHGA